MLGFVTQFLTLGLTNHFIRNPKYGNKGLYYALAILIAVSLVTIWVEAKDQPINYFKFLEVDRDCSLADLKKAYKEQAVKYHPDKNPSPTAQEEFQYVRQAYEVLQDGVKRQRYDKYGPDFIDNEEPTTPTFIGSATYYVLWAVFTYLFTMPQNTKDARSWSYTGLVVILVLEIQMRLGNMDMGKTIFPRTTIYEKIGYIHEVYSFFLNACRLISIAYFVDRESETRQLLQAIVDSNTRVIKAINDLEQRIYHLECRNDGSAAKNAPIPDEVKQRAKHAQAVLGAPPENPHLKKPNPEKKKKIPTIVWMIGLYMLYYLLK